MGTQSLAPKGRSLTQFSVHVYCGQTAAWIKMPLGTEVGLDVDPATRQKKGHTHPTQFLAHVYCGQMAGWMKTPLFWYGSRPRPRPHCTRRGPSSHERGTAAALFGPCLLWPRSSISAAAELLSVLFFLSLLICVIVYVCFYCFCYHLCGEIKYIYYCVTRTCDLLKNVYKWKVFSHVCRYKLAYLTEELHFKFDF